MDFIQHDWTRNDKNNGKGSFNNFPRIDLGVKLNQDSKVEMALALITQKDASAIFGTQHGGSTAANDMISIMYRHYGSVVQTWVYFGSKKTSAVSVEKFVSGTKRILKIDKESYTVSKPDGTVLIRVDTSNSGTFTTHTTPWVYLANSVQPTQIPNVQDIYWLKLYDNGEIIRDFIPAVNLLDEVGFYCLASDKFYKSPTPVPLTAGPRTPVWPKSKPYEE